MLKIRIARNDDLPYIHLCLERAYPDAHQNAFEWLKKGIENEQIVIMTDRNIIHGLALLTSVIPNLFDGEEIGEYELTSSCHIEEDEIIGVDHLTIDPKFRYGEELHLFLQYIQGRFKGWSVLLKNSHNMDESKKAALLHEGFRPTISELFFVKPYIKDGLARGFAW